MKVISVRSAATDDLVHIVVKHIEGFFKMTKQESGYTEVECLKVRMVSGFTFEIRCSETDFINLLKE